MADVKISQLLAATTPLTGTEEIPVVQSGETKKATVSSIRDNFVSLTTDVVVLVRNNTGSTLTKGTVVYITGATGQTSTVSKAIASGDATSAQTLGMIREDIANNATGYVVAIGLITNINTSEYTDGQQLYLSSTVLGGVTTVKPYAPTHLVYVGIVEYAHPPNGKIFVKVQNGYELDELHDVSAQTPSNGQTIVYNSSTQLWESSTVSLTNGVSGTLPVANGGTGTTSTQFANLTSNVTGTLPVANGGTGATTFTANNVLLGNGTSAFQVVAPGANGNVLTSNGTTWVSSTLAGSVSSISFGTTGLTPSAATGGAITVAGTLAAANGGTGLTSPGANGNVLTSNGTAWVSSAPAAPSATGAQGFITQATGANQPPGSFSSSDSFALI